MKKTSSVVNQSPAAAGGVLLGDLPATAGTFEYDETSALEQTLLDQTIAAPVRIGSIWLDMTNVTQNTTISLYHKVDGTNYRKFQENTWTFGVDDPGVLVDQFTAYSDVKITLQCGGGGAGDVDVPYAVV